MYVHRSFVSLFTHPEITPCLNIPFIECFPFQIVIPGPQVPLSDLYLEPFRWDQRLYSLVLRMAATDDRSRELTNGNQFVEKASDSPINAMCEVTGGM